MSFHYKLGYHPIWHLKSKNPSQLWILFYCDSGFGALQVLHSLPQHLGSSAAGNMSCSLSPPLPCTSARGGTWFLSQNTSALCCTESRAAALQLGGRKSVANWAGKSLVCPWNATWGSTCCSAHGPVGVPTTAGRNDSEHTIIKLHISAGLRVSMKTGP